MFEQAQIQEFKEVGGFGRNDRGSLTRCDLQLFPQHFQIGDSWFATRGSLPGFESFYFKSANKNLVTLLNTALPRSFPGARTPQRSRQHPGEQENISQPAPTCCARSSSRLTPCTAGTRSFVDPSYRDNWSQLGELMAQTALPTWREDFVQGRGSVGH